METAANSTLPGFGNLVAAPERPGDVLHARGPLALGALLILLVGLAVLFWPQPAHASYGQCIWEGGPGASTYPACKLEDCIGAGGVALCSEPEITPSAPAANVDGQKFTYGMCDFAAPNLGSAVRWCIAEGGTWVGGTQTGGCQGLPSPFNTGGANSDALAVSTSTSWENELTQSCSRTISNDTGWGFDDSGDQTCGGSRTLKNGQIMTDVRKLTYAPASCGSGTTIIILTKRRQLQCPSTSILSYQRTLPNGNMQCVQPVESCPTCTSDTSHDKPPLTILNPVSPVTGAKIESATDYRAGGLGGLEFGHYYNSQGRYRPPGGGPFISTFSDYWHFSYDRQLIPVSGNSGMMAYVRRESGAIEAFDTSGHEILNRSGAADRLAGSSSAGWTLTLANSDVESYNTNGNLVTVKTRAGIVTTISYGTNGKMTQAIDSFGHKLVFGYDSSNNLNKLTLPDGTSNIQYGYDSVGRLATVTYADSSSISYQYEDTYNAWLLTGITDESAIRYATYRYTQSGTMAHEEHAGGVASYDFNVTSASSTISLTYVTDPLQQNRSYTASNSAGVFQLTNTQPYCPDCPNLGQATFDANGNYQSKADLNGHQTSYAYDLTRNLETSRTEGLGSGGATTAATRTITTQWDPTFRLPKLVSVYSGASATGTALRTTSYVYDSYGNIKTRTITDPATSAIRNWTYTYYNSGLYGQVQTLKGPRTDVTDTTTYTYYSCTSGAQCGQIQKITDALGHTTTFNTYDANAMPLTITDQNGTVTTLTYDLRQRVKTRTAGTEQTKFDYYPTGLLKKMTRPDGSYLSYIYDPAHRLTEIDDALGNRTVYTLDNAGNRQQEQQYDASGTLTRTRTQLYNGVGELWQNLTSAGTDAQATVYGYDNAGNQTSISAPLSRTTGNQYDELNRLNQITDPASGITGLGYDALDNLTSVADPRKLKTQYTFNGLGDLTQLQSPDTGLTTYTPDSAGNVHLTKDARGATATASYDALNRLSQTVYSDQTFGYTYDQGTNGIGRLSSVTDASGKTSFGYDTLGRTLLKTHTIGTVSLPVGYTYLNGNLNSLTTPSGQKLVYAYDGNNQISSITLNGTTLISAIHYSPFGPTTGWTWGNGTQTVRRYDLDGRTSEIDSAGTSTYAFFDDGNISSRSDDTEHDYSVVSGTTNLTISPTSNQVASTSGALVRTYGYDNAGNTQSIGAETFGYNSAGRMSSAKQGSASVTFGVNALGQRVSKNSAAGTALFAYDEAGHLLGEYSSSGALVQETVWLGDIPIATLRPNGTNPVSVYYVHTDHLNTPRRVTRATDNTVVWRWSSDPYGLGFVDQNPSGAGTFIYNLRFPGQYSDSETGLNQNVFRDYDPAVGRYGQSDPIGLDGGASTYAYADSNPISESDATGLDPGGGPYHPPEGTRLKCTDDDSCAMLSGKMWVLMRVINSHQLWDWLNPPPRGGGRHAKEIADLWRAYARCQALHKQKCEDCPPKQQSVPVMPLPEWTPAPTPAPLRIPLEPIFVP